MEKNRQTPLTATKEHKQQDQEHLGPDQNEQENTTNDIIEIVDSLP